MLQAYGLKRAIEDLGHRIEFIDYMPPALSEKWWKVGVRSGMFPGILVLRPKYHAFQKTNFTRSAPVENIARLRAIAGDYDAIVVGSDQVWNSALLKQFDPLYFLDLLDDNMPCRISYAACFGRPDHPADFLAQAKPLLKKFHHVSVRNPISAEIVFNLLGWTPQIVVDPTFLHDFASLDGDDPQVSGKYVLVNCLHRCNAVALLELARKVARARDGKIVALSTNYGLLVDGVIIKGTASPTQWLALMKRADFVLTDSFHGAVFSIKNGRPFIASLEAGGWRAHRISVLLNQYGLADRLLTGDQCDNLDAVCADIDYKDIREAIARDAAESMNYLDAALSQCEAALPAAV
jgi:hypothetical protein